MHAPFLTALRDTNGDGQGRRAPRPAHRPRPAAGGELQSGCTAPTAWSSVTMAGCTWRSAIAAATSRGRKGTGSCFKAAAFCAAGPMAATCTSSPRGLRNIYDVALDDELNVFVRDNENDGGDLQDPRVPQLLRRRSRLSRTCTTNGRTKRCRRWPTWDLAHRPADVCYLETAVSRRVSRQSVLLRMGPGGAFDLRSSSAGASFRALKEIDFAAGAANDPYGFKPTDLVVDRDGSLFVSDWCDGQRPQRGRGRIYRIRHTGTHAKPDSFRHQIRRTRPTSSPARLGKLSRPSRGARRIGRSRPRSARGCARSNPEREDWRDWSATWGLDCRESPGSRCHQPASRTRRIGLRCTRASPGSARHCRSDRSGIGAASSRRRAGRRGHCSQDR